MSSLVLRVYDKNMCGRFSFQPNAEMLKSLAPDKQGLFETGDIIVPNMDILFYRQSGTDVAKWGFKPNWAEEDFKATTHNARSETIHQKATFRDQWEQGNRCFIPANYFFEWQHGSGLGFTVHPTQSDFLYFAGLWQENQHGLRVTILTKASGDHVRHIHRRMPIMLERDILPRWLKGSHLDAINLIAAANDENLEIRDYNPPKKEKPQAQASFF